MPNTVARGPRPGQDSLPHSPLALHHDHSSVDLYRRDHNLKYHRYQPHDPESKDLLDYLDSRADPIFWG